MVRHEYGYGVHKYDGVFNFDDSTIQHLGYPASYIIFKDGDTIYAKNGDTGKVDFSGTDAATVIQDTINNCDSGGLIFIKKGVYDISSTIEIPYNGIYICGEKASIKSDLSDKKGTFLSAASNIEAIFKATKSYIRGLHIESLGLDCNSKAQYGVYISKGGEKNTVKNCFIIAFTQAGIYVSHSSIHHYEIEILENKIMGRENSGSPYGIYIGSLASDNYIAHNLIQGCDTGIYLEYGTNIIIQNHISKVPATSYSYGIYWKWAAGNLIVANQIDNPTTSAFYGWADSQIIIGNYIQVTSTNLQSCLKLDPPSSLSYSHIIFTNNILRGDSGYTISNSVSLGTNASTSPGIVVNNNVYENVTNIFKLENSGTATISNGSTSVTVTHGLAGTPTEIQLTGTHSEVKDAYVQNVGSTTFDIVVDSAVSADRTVYWKAVYKP